MLYVVKNITQHNIDHNGDIIKPGEQRNLLNVDNLSIMFKMGHMTCKTITPQDIQKTETIQEQHKDIIECFFKFYINMPMSDNELIQMKTFYKEVLFAEIMDNKILTLINNVSNRDEMVEILLNYIYPKLISSKQL